MATKVHFPERLVRTIRTRCKRIPLPCGYQCPRSVSSYEMSPAFVTFGYQQKAPSQAMKEGAFVFPLPALTGRKV